MTFNSGDTSKTFDFTATQDALDDDGESVELAFGTTLPVGVSEGSPSETTVSITDDDDPGVTVSFGAAVPIRRRRGARPRDGDAERGPGADGRGPDHRDEPGRRDRRRLLGGAGQRDLRRRGHVQDLRLRGDPGHGGRRRREREAGVRATLPAGVSEGSPSETTVSIRDDDDPGVTVSFGAATYTAAEGGTATVTVTLSADPERTVEVRITATNQGGATAADYSGVPASVTFDAGDTSQPITFAATQDTEDDDGESVKLGFGTTLPARVSPGSPSETTVSITDDDDPGVTVSFGAATYTAAEGGTATVTVTLSADPERTVAIPDHQDQPGRGDRLRLLGRARQRHLRRRGHLEDDHLHGNPGHGGRRRGEREAGVRATLPAGVSAGSPSETTVSIRDDDDPGVTVSFGAAHLYGGGGGHGHGYGDAERGPGADGRGPDHRDEPGRRDALPTTRGCPPASPSTPGTRPRPSTSRRPRTRRTTMGRA